MVFNSYTLHYNVGIMMECKYMMGIVGLKMLGFKGNEELLRFRTEE